MPTNFNLPGAGQYTFLDYIGISPSDSNYALFPSVLQQGGFQEMPTLQDRNEIPVLTTGSGFGTPSIGGDGWSSGRRRVGMLVYVLENQKFYSLIPQGYWGNGGNLGVTEWLALTDEQKYELLDPTATYNGAFTPPNNYAQAGGNGSATDCWVELEFGGDGTYNSSITNTNIEMVADVGGLVQGTSVGDLSGIYTYDDLFDAMLFPTSNPEVSPAHSVGLSNSVGSLGIIGSTQNVTLDTTANKGLIKLDGVTQGPYAGAVTAATISGPTFSGTVTLTVGPGDTDVSNPEATAHEIVLGTAGNKWTSVTTFAAGPDPIDSAGNVYGAIKFQGGDKTTSTQIEGVYPIFLGNNSNAFDQRALISHGANNIQCDQTYGETNGSLHHRISVPDAMVNGRTIQVWQFSSVSNSYSEATGAWVTSSETRTIESNAIGYTLLSKTGSAGGSNLYRIKFV